MSRRSPEQIAKDEKYVLYRMKAVGPATKEDLWQRIDNLHKSDLDAALRSLVKQKKVKKKGNTRAMVYTAK